MATIKAFRGVRYSPAAGKLEDLTTPPYDVIGKHAEAAYGSRSPYNIINLDITKDPGGRLDREQERYARPARLLKTWLEDSILIRDRCEGLYPYDIEYTIGDSAALIRKGFIGLVKLEEFEAGIIKPHEQTFASVAEDRLELMKTCRANFSQVFSCYSDPGNRVIDMLAQHRGDPVSVTTDSDNCVHSLYQVCNEDVLAAVCQEFVDKSLYIADGHHRYRTALTYRNESRVGNSSGDGPEAYIMMYLCPMEDRGLSILAPHRLLKYPGVLTAGDVLDRLHRFFSIEEIGGASRELLLAELLSRMKEDRNNQRAANIFGFYHPGEDRSFLLALRDGAAKKIEIRNNCLRELDVVILSHLLIKKSLKLTAEAIEAGNLLTYHSDVHEALDVSVKICAANEAQTPLLFLINQTTIEQVKRVSDEGLFMPHKSTYFYPKIVSGMVINVFDQEN
jgi:uncharacterized protein (DUF1015 family)